MARNPQPTSGPAPNLNRNMTSHFLPRQVHDGYPHPIAQVTAIDLSVSRLPLHLAILAIPGDLLNNIVLTHQKEAEDDVDRDPGPGAET
ncbi:MAG: hypothetical protein Q9172_006838 [Xanthocarpia lactea]